MISQGVKLSVGLIKFNFWPFPGTFYALTSPNINQVTKKVVPISLHKTCKNHFHWAIFGGMALLQKTTFDEFWKKLPSFGNFVKRFTF